MDQGSVIDGVVFIIPIGTSEDSALLDVLSENIVTVLDNNITPIVVVNCVNTVSSQEAKAAFNKIFEATHLSERVSFLFFLFSFF